MNVETHQLDAQASDSGASWENEGGAISSAAKAVERGGARLLLPRSSTHPPSREGSDVADSVASLNSDGARNWFIPPYVIPSAIAALVVIYAVYRG